jgi:hypothetical protein
MPACGVRIYFFRPNSGPPDNTEAGRKENVASRRGISRDFVQRVDVEASFACNADHLVGSRRRVAHSQDTIALVEEPDRDWVEDLVEGIVADSLRSADPHRPAKRLESGFKPAKVDWFRTNWSLIRCSRSVRPIFFSFEMSLLRMPSEPFTDGRRNPPTECWYKPLAGPVNIVQNGPART